MTWINAGNRGLRYCERILQCNMCAAAFAGRRLMTRNMGGFDRLVRFYLGLAMIAFAMPFWAPQTGWNWVGWFGIVPIVSAVLGSCGFYRIVGLSTRPAH
jgi:hypothetical protein